MPKRPVRIDGDVAFVELSSGDISVIDARFADRIGEWNWTALRTKSGHIYAKRGAGGKSVMLHREIIGVTDSKVYVDHVDGDTLNNRMSNLRFSTPSENRRNQILSSANTSGLKGVSKRGNRFVAQIQCNGIVKHLGQFSSEAEAHACYCGAAIILHGDFWCDGNRSEFADIQK